MATEIGKSKPRWADTIENGVLLALRVLREIWSIIWNSIMNFLSDDAMTYAGALAFFTSLSLAPLLVILITIIDRIDPVAQYQIVEQINILVSPRAGEFVNFVLHNIGTQPLVMNISAIIGILALVFAATRMFVQLQTAMNRIWNIKAMPGRDVQNWFRKRVLSLGIILILGFLLLASLLANVVISFIFVSRGVLWAFFNMGLPWVFYLLLFATIYKFLPDAVIAWKDVWVGAILTASMFALGKYLIGRYLGYSDIGSAYGAAGSLVVLLVWVFYSSIIVLFGAEVMKIWALRYGTRIVPARHAVWLPGAEEVAARCGPRRERESPPELEEGKNGKTENAAASNGTGR